MTQGLNRQIRRMCEYLGWNVMRLVRLRVMNIELGILKSGEYREVTKAETGTALRPAEVLTAHQKQGKEKGGTMADKIASE